ncbi:MAG: Sapep family Mn(2+)-dependent dipeptidase [Clostridiales bacterium]|nr:Sapep family Mn(2+)-dependent dipeptidase [Clostridiales bacterium]
MLNDLGKLIAVQSVMGEPKEGAPFGEGPRAALDAFLEMAKGYGFTVKNENGYCGWAEIGSGKHCIGILGHLDVVPAGDGWSHPPYSLVCEDSLLYGRGVADDKGATVACLHAMKQLKEEGAPLHHRIRLIVGCNEENGSKCIEYYREHCEIPVASFVPDADFPVINSEKGILRLTLALQADKAFTQNIVAFEAGIRPNVIPDLCTVKVPKNSALYECIAALGTDSSLFKQPTAARVIVEAGYRPEDFSVHFFENELVLEARGVAGHAMAPERGENAVRKMVAFLSGMNGTKDSALIKTLAAYLALPEPQKALGVEAKDDESGELTINLGLASYRSGAMSVTLDLRLPICADHEKVTNEIRKKTGAKLVAKEWSPNLYVPKDSKLVTALLDAYHKVTGGEKTCLYCGGGTYARELPNAVAFGPTFPNLETNLHNVDESFPVELFDKLPQIYKEAITALDAAYDE